MGRSAKDNHETSFNQCHSRDMKFWRQTKPQWASLRSEGPAEPDRSGAIDPPSGDFIELDYIHSESSEHFTTLYDFGSRL